MFTKITIHRICAWKQFGPLPFLALAISDHARQNFSFQYQYNINQTGDENKEKYKFEDFLVDPVPNSERWHHHNCMADSKEYPYY